MSYLLLAISTPTTLAQDWPQWRGPQRDGVVNDFATPAVWPEKLKLVWKTPVGGGYSSPVVSQGKVWLHSRKDETEVVSCFDYNIGKLLWSQSYPSGFNKNQYATQMGKGPFSTPVLYQGHLYTLGVSAVLSCFDAATGVLKWRRDFGVPNTSKMFCGTAMSPLIDGGNVIVHVGDDIRDGQMIAVNAKTGQESWKLDCDGPGYASPILATLGGTRQLVTMTRKSVIGVAAQTGQLLWTLPWADDWDENIVTPLQYKDLLILSGVRKGTLAVRVTKQAAQWQTQQVWHNAELTMYMNSPVLSGEHFFGFTNKRKGQLFCLEAATGKVLWTTEGRDGANAALLNTPAALLMLTADGNLFAVQKSAQGFKQLAKYAVADSATYAHPVVGGKRILVKDEAALALWSLE
ncbi:MAG: PQQ-like beta-propeller repeat protein [Acidobacteria bacterium]|nr:PQQ-like beta-propeller repeat protein [Acidobacteriota bacterium]MBI3422752.1 PQQ-like beta-propeller repeat protein [Acidobacteriota bacterium]